MQNPRYPTYKLTVLALLTLNTALFALIDTWAGAADSVVWLLLLVSYELETYKTELPFSTQTMLLIRKGLIAVLPLVFIGYLLEAEVLDAFNALLWFALIGLLELEAIKPGWIANNQQTYWAATIFVFIGLIALVGIWVALAAWLDAYDAALWIIAFAIIEVDIFRVMQEKLIPN